MKKFSFPKYFLLLFIIISLQSCQAIGDIFKAGMWSGIIIVVLIIGVVLYIISKGARK